MMSVFTYKKGCNPTPDSTNKWWAVVGEKGAVRFWVTRFYNQSEHLLGAIEYHEKVDEALSAHRYCPLLDGPCFMYGDTMYAQAVYIPLFKEKGDDDWIFEKLKEDYRSYFDEEIFDVPTYAHNND